MEGIHHDHPCFQLWSDYCVSQRLIFMDSATDCVRLGPMVTPGIQVVAMKYNVSLDMVSSLIIGFLAFWIGFTTFFTASGANIWGKRPFFVISSIILFMTNIWGFFSSVSSHIENPQLSLLIILVVPFVGYHESNPRNGVSASRNVGDFDRL